MIICYFVTNCAEHFRSLHLCVWQDEIGDVLLQFAPITVVTDEIVQIEVWVHPVVILATEVIGNDHHEA